MNPRNLIAHFPCVIVVGAILFSGAGCVRYADIRSETRPLSGASVGERHQEKACLFTLLNLIPFGEHPLPVAKQRMVAKARADGLVDMDIKTDVFFVLVGYVTCVELVARPAWLRQTRRRGATVGQARPRAPSPAPPTTAGPTRASSDGASSDGASSAKETRLTPAPPKTAGQVLVLGSQDANLKAAPILTRAFGRPVRITLKSGKAVSGVLVRLQAGKILIRLKAGARLIPIPMANVAKVELP